MKIGTKEHYELLEMFERDFKGIRIDKEPKELWAAGAVYQDGVANNLFKAYSIGYSYGKSRTL